MLGSLRIVLKKGQGGRLVPFSVFVILGSDPIFHYKYEQHYHSSQIPYVNISELFIGTVLGINFLVGYGINCLVGHHLVKTQKFG